MYQYTCHTGQRTGVCAGQEIGGCTVNLVANERVEDFAQALAQGYESQTRLHPEIYITRASNGAELLK